MLLGGSLLVVEEDRLVVVVDGEVVARGGLQEGVAAGLVVGGLDSDALPVEVDHGGDRAATVKERNRMGEQSML